MNLEFYVVDAFIDPEKPFSGNPAAVIVLPENFPNISDEIKQNIALQFNLSETVYLSPFDDHWTIRWFTPEKEVKLCGHATVAASYVLAKLNNVKHLKYKSDYHDKLEAIYDDNEESIILDFPLNDTVPYEASWMYKIKQAVIGSENMDHIIDVQYSNNTGKLLFRLKDDDSSKLLAEIKPDFQKLLELDMDNVVRGIIVTQKPVHYKNVHFWSRYFAPWFGINEDPVCGSAHTVLTPYWSRMYQKELGIVIDEFHAQQLSKRSGLLKCRLNGNRVMIKGQAKIFSHGTIQQKF